MNWEQIKAILWLRWRLTRNRFARAGALNAVLSLIMLGALTVGGLVFGVVGVILGVFVLDKADSRMLLLVWDGVLFAFLIIWFSGLMVEIQRSESIDLDKLLHLPVTLQQVFVFNYLASHLTPAIVLLVPGMVGLCLGLVFGFGARMALLLPLVLGFVFMLTAWTYCLRGWLAALMVNKRRRRAIMVWVTIVFVLLSQLPNLLMNSRTFYVHPQSSKAPSAQPRKGLGLPENFVQGHLLIPPGWVGYGAMQLGLNNPWPGLGATGACWLLGALGLMRAYRMTIRFYQSADGVAPAGAGAPVTSRLPGMLLVERNLPWLPPDTAALTLATFRSLTRAPELKMALIMPLVMVVLVISSQLRSRSALPEFVTGFVAAGAGVAAVFSFVQAMANMFGLDRNGFRALVLLPTPRHHILLAKNLALFPFVGCTGLLLLLATKVFMKITWLDFVAGVLQLPLAFATFCLACNVMSVLVPYRLSQSTLKAKQPKPVVFLAVFISLLVMPPLMAPVLIPPGLQFLFSFEGWVPWLPVNILATLVMMAAIGAVYWAVLPAQGNLLQCRELRILKEVTEEVE